MTMRHMNMIVITNKDATIACARVLQLWHTVL